MTTVGHNWTIHRRCRIITSGSLSFRVRGPLVEPMVGVASVSNGSVAVDSMRDSMRSISFSRPLVVPVNAVRSVDGCNCGVSCGRVSNRRLSISFRIGRPLMVATNGVCIAHRNAEMPYMTMAIRGLSVRFRLC